MTLVKANFLTLFYILYKIYVSRRENYEKKFEFVY